MRKFIIIAFLGYTSFLNGQRLPYPFLYHVTTKCKVSYNSNNGLYSYSYVITNDSINKGVISYFNIDISRGINSITYDTVGLTFYSKLSEIYFSGNYPRLMSGIIPIGFPSFPKKGWFGHVGGVFSEASIHTDSLGIVPGQTVNSIILTSKALPGIRKIRFEPDFWDDYYFQYDDTTNTDDIDSIRHVINFYGFTISPSAPPINFIATLWCDTLTNYTTQSRSLGWIKDDSTKNKYLVFFSFAKTKLLQLDSVGAKTFLQQVLKDVDIDSASTLTSEAYALLRFNTEYLNMRLFVLPTK